MFLEKNPLRHQYMLSVLIKLDKIDVVLSNYLSHYVSIDYSNFKETLILVPSEVMTIRTTHGI